MDTTAAMDRGDELVDASEYDGAVEAYATALQSALGIADVEQRELALGLVRVRLSKAHRMAYEADGKSTHLLEVERLVNDQRAQSPDPNADIDELAAWLESQQRVARRGERKPAGADGSDQTPPSPPRPTRSRTMVLAGTAITGLGGGLTVGFLVLVGLTVNARANYDRADENIGMMAWNKANRSTFRAALATAVLAGAALATGVALIVVGKRGRKRESIAAGGFPLRSGAGAALSGRF